MADGTPARGTDPLIGTTLVDRYVIEQVLADGALGRVYLARHARQGRRYAIKAPSRAAADPVTRKQFVLDAEAASLLDHPNVVGVLDFGETSHGLTYLVMEYAPGEPLTHHLAARRMSVTEALDLVRQLALGLDHAHDRGLVHRDLTTDHVVVDRHGRPRIVDFGFAALRDMSGSTGAASALTAHYIAPEQILGEPADPRSDLYALGVIFYEALAGCRPFDGTGVMRQTIRERLPTFRERAPRLVIPPRVETLCRRMLEKLPAHRPQSARAVVHAIDAILAER
jgi:serine/threonine-protein kinase